MDEKKFLENIAKFLQVENVLENIEQKSKKNNKCCLGFNTILNELSGKETIPEEKEYIEETATQPYPEIPVKNIVNRSVEALSQVPQKKIQQTVDSIPNGIRKELDILKNPF